MSKEKKVVAPDVKREPLYLEDIQAQVQASEINLSRLQNQLAQVQSAIQQEVGIINHSRHLLSAYNLPNKPKPEVKTEGVTPAALEVK